jgi:hypothetical protein
MQASATNVNKANGHQFTVPAIKVKPLVHLYHCAGQWMQGKFDREGFRKLTPILISIQFSVFFDLLDAKAGFESRIHCVFSYQKYTN